MLEITNQDMVEIMVRSYSQRSSLSSALNQKIQIIIDAKNQEIKEKEILLENTQDALKLALFEAEGIE